MSANAITILRGARAKIEKGWHKGYLAALPDKQPTHPTDPNACSFCLLGAIYAANDGVYSNADLTAAIQAAYRLFPFGQSFGGWNDMEGRTKEEVLELIDQAVARMEKRLEPSPNL